MGQDDNQKPAAQETANTGMPKNKPSGRRLEGTVVSTKMKKTLVVAISSLRLHSKYKKHFKNTKRFKVHNEDEGKYSLGDKVVIQETRPISKEKRWRVIGKV